MLSERISVILPYLFAVTLVASSHLPQPDCYASYGQRIKDKILHPCTLRKADTLVANLSEWNPPKKAFKLNLTDSEKGVVSVKFPIPGSISKFSAILRLDESAKNEEECKKSNFKSGCSTHSMKHFQFDHCMWAENETLNSSSTVFVETELQNVFTGCYQLKIPINGLKNFYSDSVFIQSDYELKFIQVPDMKYDYSSHKHKLYFTFEPLNQSWMKEKQIHLYTPYPIGVENLSNENCLVVDIHPNVTVQQCETTNPNHKRPACQPKAAGLECTIYNITPGNYCIRAEVLNDDRCDNTLWTRKENRSCTWIYTLAAKNYDSSNTTDKITTSDGSSFYIYVVLGTIASLVLIAAIVHGIRSSKDHFIAYQAGHSKSDYRSKILPKEKVLLLYAHDCQRFMDLMSTFRNILQKNFACEVYDMFDPLQWGTIARGRQEWIQRVLSQDDAMIVIVDSMSAVLHQNALENNFAINYFQPQPNSHLFTYALQSLTNNIQRNVYKKIFVVRFSGFSENGQTLRHIAPLRRYLLPEHLSQLFSFLKETSSLDVEDCCPDDTKDAEDLQRQLDKLISFKVQNPEYLKTVLYMSTKIV